MRAVASVHVTHGMHGSGLFQGTPSGLQAAHGRVTAPPLRRLLRFLCCKQKLIQMSYHKAPQLDVSATDSRAGVVTGFAVGSASRHSAGSSMHTIR